MTNKQNFEENYCTLFLASPGGRHSRWCFYTMAVFVNGIGVCQALGKSVKRNSFPLMVAGPHSCLLQDLLVPSSCSKNPLGHPSKPACSRSNPYSKIMSSCPLLSKQKVCLLSLLPVRTGSWWANSLQGGNDRLLAGLTFCFPHHKSEAWC